MRFIYPENDINDEGPTLISEKTETLVHRIAAALMIGHTDHAMMLAHEFRCDCHKEGQDAANKAAKDYAEEENRRAAAFGHGKVEFRTSDGLKCVDRLTLNEHDYYQPVWKRACRVEHKEVFDDSAVTFGAVPVRTYEFRGERTSTGLPVYEEVL